MIVMWSFVFSPGSLFASKHLFDTFVILVTAAIKSRFATGQKKAQGVEPSPSGLSVGTVCGDCRKPIIHEKKQEAKLACGCFSEHVGLTLRTHRLRLRSCGIRRSGREAGTR